MSNIPFGLKYLDHKALRCSPTGDKIQMEHTPHMGLDGKRKLILDDAKPIYEMIQAHREETEIDRIVKRAMQGDMSALNAVAGQYMDIAGAPNSLAEAQQIIINAKRDFDKLDPEIKKKFDNNVEIFIAEAGSKEWADKLGITAKIEADNQSKAEAAEFEKDLKSAMKNLAGSSKKIDSTSNNEKGETE